MSNGELSYPNLAGCKVVVQSSIAPSRLPVQLSRECWDAANISIEPLYAFTLGKNDFLLGLAGTCPIRFHPQYLLTVFVLQTQKSLF